MIKVRPAVLKDCAVCANLSKIEELKAPSGWTPTPSYFKQLLKEKQIVVVAEEGKEIVGYVSGEVLHLKVGMLWFTAVSPAHQGKGVGSLLIKAFEKESKKRGVRWIVLYAPKFNKKTLNFYEKKGYKKGHEVVEFAKSL